MIAWMSSSDGPLGPGLPFLLDDQELLLHDQAISNNSPCATAPQEFGDRGQ